MIAAVLSGMRYFEADHQVRLDLTGKCRVCPEVERQWGLRMAELKEVRTFRVAEVAEILQISDDKVRRLMHGGWIRYIRIGREMRVTRSEMLRILTDGTSPNS